MEFNECEICGANNGRAGLLIGDKNRQWLNSCMNCHDTRVSGNIVIHTNLQRTEKEIKITMSLVNCPTGHFNQTQDQDGRFVCTDCGFYFN